MTTAVEPRRSFPDLVSERPPPLHARLRAFLLRMWRPRRAGILWLLPVVVAGAVVHAWGMTNFPRWVDDPGTYLSQAWSVQYEHNLSPYSYFYDHAPGGWIQIALWSMLTRGFDRYDSAMAFGNECMLISKVASIVLLYWLGRRLRFSRPAAAAAGLIFALNPLALAYTRWTFLDNLVTPWILLAFALALSRRRTLFGAVGAGLAFAIAALTKETTLVLAPALLWALVQNSDRRNRAHVVVMSCGLSLLVMATYPVYALTKGEFFEGPGHNSLLGTARWQLLDRQASGSILDPASSVSRTVSQWLTYDPTLVAGGLLAVPLLLLVARLRPVAICLLLQAVVVARGGYVPAMQVVNILPWCCLAVPGAVEVLRGNPLLRTVFGRRRRRHRPAPDTAPAVMVSGEDLARLGPWSPSLFEPGGQHMPPMPQVPRPRPSSEPMAAAPTPAPARRRLRVRDARRSWAPASVVRTVAVLAAVAALTVDVAPRWGTELVFMTTVSAPPELAQATGWVADNVPRDQVVVVHDAIWTDLVQRYGFPKDDVIMAYKLDADPAVHARLTHLDYLVVPDWYYTIKDGKYPTLIEAQHHAVPAAHFGAGPDAVTVWRVSGRWKP
jgi:Dolichyl-phosphate-mannose-protein mannosyltransferase